MLTGVMAGRVMLSGMVYVKYGHEYKTRFLVARCQGSVSPAKLEVFIADGHSRSTMSKLQELSFKGLKDVFVANEGSSKEAKKLITLQAQEGEGLKFYSKSEVEHNTWYIYCYVLANIPTYPIPDVSHHQIPLDSFKQEVEPKSFNAVSVWRVYIINEGVGKTLKCRGFHNITINRDSTLSIINSCNQVPLATWDRDKIRRSGCLESLVFLEAGRRCQGGPGMLWMYCPQNAVDFGECLHRFLFNKTTGNDAVNFPSPMYPQNYASPSCHLDAAQNSSVNISTWPATSLAKSSCVSHNTDTSRDHHTCKSFTRLVQNSHTALLSPTSEDHIRDNEWDITQKDNDVVAELSHSPSQCFCLNNRNVKCIAPHKPPILPRTIKRNKPPVPPRTLTAPSANYSEHHTIEAPKPGMQISGATESQAVAKPVCDGHQNQTRTHETVVLRRHQRCSNGNDREHHGDASDIEQNALLSCWVDFTERLDIASLLPHLCTHHLLTMLDRERLTNQSTTNFEKVIHLLSVLPKKDGWYKKFLDCLCQSAEGTGHAGLATTLKQKYEELKKSKINTQTGSSNKETPTKSPTESFPVHLELKDSSSVHTFNVTSAELVESLVEKIRTELKIDFPFDITLKVDPLQKLHSRNSMIQSRVRRNSFITIRTQDSSC